MTRRRQGLTKQLSLPPFFVRWRGGIGRGRIVGMRYLRVLLMLPSVVCFAAAYRFASHGISGQDAFCIGLAAAAVAVGSALLGVAFWTPSQKAVPDKL